MKTRERNLQRKNLVKKGKNKSSAKVQLWGLTFILLKINEPALIIKGKYQNTSRSITIALNRIKIYNFALPI